MRLPPPIVKVCAAVSAAVLTALPAFAQAPGGSSGGGGAGQAQRVAQNMGRVLFWCAVLVGAAVLLAVVFLVIRKRLASLDDESPSMGGNLMGFTLADLRQMHAAGQISDEEFDVAKRKMAARAKAQLDSDDADPDHEPEFIDLGDLTEAGDNHPPAPPDKDNPAADPPTDPPGDDAANKNDGPGEEPGDDAGDEPPSKPPQHW